MSSAEQTGSTQGNDEAAQTPAGATEPVSEQPASDPTFVYDPLAPDPVSPNSPTAGAAPDDDSTVGTGTSIALGCIVGTMLLIFFAIVLLFIYSVIVS